MTSFTAAMNLMTMKTINMEIIDLTLSKEFECVYFHSLFKIQKEYTCMWIMLKFFKVQINVFIWFTRQISWKNVSFLLTKLTDLMSIYHEQGGKMQATFLRTSKEWQQNVNFVIFMPMAFRWRSGTVKHESMDWQQITTKGFVSEKTLIGAKNLT